MKKWVINKLESLSKDEKLKDFVVECHWSRVANEIINNKEYFASTYGTQSFSSENITEFINYEDLTYDIVCGWLDNSIDYETLDISLDNQIENQINPPIITLPLPWVK